VDLSDYNLLAPPSSGAAAKAFVGGYGKAYLSELVQMENYQNKDHEFEDEFRGEET